MTVAVGWRSSAPLLAAVALAAGLGSATVVATGQAGASGAQGKAVPQKIDAEYTAKIKEYTQDPREITELVDHMPASQTVPSPLKFLGRIPGTPDELTYYKDIASHLLRGGPVPVTGEDGRRTIAVFEAAERSSKSGKTEPVAYE